MSNPTQITSLRIPTENIGAAKSLVEADSGKTFVISSDAAFTVTLPGVKAAGNGWNCTIVIGVTGTTGATTITEKTSVDTDVLAGSTATAADGTAAEANEGFTTVTFDATARQKGDQISIIGNGTNFYVTGISASATAMVFA